VAETAGVCANLLVDRSAMLAGVGFLVRLIAEILQFDIEVVGAEEIAEM